jgi:NTP pyrophosphatase (non-canonical NTP hydrolase)
MILPDVADWCHRTHPEADVADGALKVCEEAGEVAAVVVKGEGLDRLGEELADVIIAATTTAHLAGINLERVLADRWDEVRAR